MVGGDGGEFNSRRRPLVAVNNDFPACHVRSYDCSTFLCLDGHCLVSLRVCPSVAFMTVSVESSILEPSATSITFVDPGMSSSKFARVQCSTYLLHSVSQIMRAVVKTSDVGCGESRHQSTKRQRRCERR